MHLPKKMLKALRLLINSDSIRIIFFSMHLISRLCGGVFCFTVAICPNRDVSWGMSEADLLFIQ